MTNNGKLLFAHILVTNPCHFFRKRGIFVSREYQNQPLLILQLTTLNGCFQKNHEAQYESAEAFNKNKYDRGQKK